jgi:hypothetical protein
MTLDFRLILKLAITAIIIVAISEIGKRSTFFGAILASLPLTSILALSWLYLDKEQNGPVSKLSMNIFWAVIPSLAFFPILSWLLRTVSYPAALGISVVATAIIYYLYFYILTFFGLP